jgi:hypothetical protein
VTSPVLSLTETIDFTIASGEALSAARHINNRIPCGIFMSAGWTAAVITLQTSLDNSTFYNIHEFDGSELTLTVAAGLYVPLDTSRLLGIGRYLRIRSGTAGTPVNQGAERVVSLSCGAPLTR